MPRMSMLDLKAMLAAERSSALAAMSAAQLVELAERKRRFGIL